VKIKEEPVDTSFSTEISEDYILNKNHATLNHEETSSSSRINVNNKENEDISNNSSAQLENAKRSFNLKHQTTENKRKGIDDDLSIIKKKRKYCNESSNKSTNALCKTAVRKLRKKTKRKCRAYSKIKRQSQVKKISCNICFRKFSSFLNCFLHMRYYENIRNYKCTVCNELCTSRDKLHAHVTMYHKDIRYPSCLHCNFCDRFYKEKIFLQSHLFHSHGELISSKNITKSYNQKIKNITSTNTSCESNALPLEREESLHSNHAVTAESSMAFINNETKPLNEITLKTEELILDNSFDNQFAPIKQLRQPTLVEYLELGKKKRDAKAMPERLSTLKDNPSTSASHRNIEKEGHIKRNFLEEHNGQTSSSVKQLSIPVEQTAHSAIKKNMNAICLPEKSFVKVHADVEMMKCFLEKLPTIKHGEDKDHTKGILRCGREIPYSLRPLKNTSFLKTNINSRKRQNGKISKRSQFVSKEYSIRTKEKVANKDSNKIDPNFKKNVEVHFKCKECIISLRRCDDNTKDDEASITDTFKKNASLIVPCDSTSFQNNVEVRNEALKELEISLERLSSTPVLDIAETVPAIKKENYDCFVCKICKKSFLSKSAKYEHIKSFHIAYMSSICNARYTAKHKLFQHYLHEHQFKENRCCVCFVLFSDYVKLKQHLYVHCLKYVQKQNDQYPLDVEIKCKSNRKKYKCLLCNGIFSSQSIFEMHQNCCSIPNKIDDQQDSVKEIDNLLKITNMSHNNIDNKISSNDLYEQSSNNSEECQISDIIYEKEIKREDDQNISGNNNNLIVENFETVNEPQDSTKSLRNSISANNDHDVACTQSDSKITDSNSLQNNDLKIIVYPCSICGKQFQNQKNLQQHIRTFNNCTDVCPICSTAFSSKRLLQSHISAAHVPQISKSYSFHCVFCNQGFVKKYELRSHVLHLHNQQMLHKFICDSIKIQKKSDTPTSSIATCNICNLVFETQDRFIEHRMYYYKNHTFTCLLCTQNFQGMYMFHHHNKLVHTSEDKRKSYTYICEICNEGFNHESHFHSHNMHVHSNEETNITKDLEGKSRSDPIREKTSEEETIRNSIAKQGSEQSSHKYTCVICQMKCSNLNDMTKHIEFYSSDGDFKCDRCNRRCKTLDVLTHHRKLTHIYRDVFDGHACHQCGEILESIISLNYHEKHFHSNINMSNKTECKNYDQISSSNITCNQQQSKSNDSLKNSIHEYKYKCSLCTMIFSSIDLMKIHIMKIHVNDLVAKGIMPKSTSLTIRDIHIKPIMQQIGVNQVSSSKNNQTQSIQQFNNMVKVILPNKNKKDEIVMKAINPLKVLLPRSGNGTENISTLKESNDVQMSTLPTISKDSNIIASTLISPESIYSHQTNDKILSMSGLINKSVNPLVKDIDQSPTTVYKTLLVIPKEMLQPVIPVIPKKVAIPKLQNKTQTNYTCPLCPLEYPSLMFFHAHMRYIHIDSVRPEMRNPLLDWRTSLTQCLMCTRTFMNEHKYKKHLKNVHTHHIYMPNSEKTRNATNHTNDSIAMTVNNNKNNISPEIITLSDDNDNVKNISNHYTDITSVITTSAPKQQNDKIGKVKVKSFAKIIENLSKERELKDLQSK